MEDESEVSGWEKQMIGRLRGRKVWRETQELCLGCFQLEKHVSCPRDDVK